MSRDLLTVREHNGIEYSLREMRPLGVRRVPVTDDRGVLAGVLSIDDIGDHLATQLGHIAGILRKGQQVESGRRP
jgi:CBS domain-containing protein